MASKRKTEQSKLDVARKMREIVRQNVVVDERTGAPPLWTDLPALSQKSIERGLRILAKGNEAGYGELRRKAQKYTQTLHERGRKVHKSELDPDHLQIAIARTKRKYVEVDFIERPRKLAAGASGSQPQQNAGGTKPVEQLPAVQTALPLVARYMPAESPSFPAAPCLPTQLSPAGQSLLSCPSPEPLSPSLAAVVAVDRMAAIKQEVEALPEVTFSAKDSPRTFLLEVLVRFHRFGSRDRRHQFQELVQCTVTLQDDLSCVESVKLKEVQVAGLHDYMHHQCEQLIGTLNITLFVNSLRDYYPRICVRLHTLSNVATNAGMVITTPIARQMETKVEFKSKDEAFAIQLEIPSSWPIYCFPVKIVSCTSPTTSIELLSRYSLDAIAQAALQPIQKGNMLRAIFEGVRAALREKEEAKWSVPEDFCYTYPHPQARDSIVLQKEDMLRLKPGSMLGDKVVNVCLRIIQGRYSESAPKVFVFDSFFLRKVADEMEVAEKNEVSHLAPAPFAKILRYAKASVDHLFSHRYLLFPLCHRSHWSALLLIMEADPVSGKLQPARILHLDSLGGQLHKGIDKYLRWFLSQVWVHQNRAGEKAVKKGVLPAFQPHVLRCIKPKVPQQRDGSNDCDVHLLPNAVPLMQRPDSAVHQLEEEGFPGNEDAPYNLRLFWRNSLMDQAEKQGLDIPL